MGDVVLMMSVSLDGYFAGPDGGLEWQLVDAELLRHFNDWLATAGAFLDGRVTYELMATYWPTADANPSATPEVVQFAEIWRQMPKVVYSRTLESVDWNARLARAVVPAEVRALKAGSDAELVLGGGGLADTFRRLDLIDQYRIYIQPMLLGRGRPLFEPSEQLASLELVETRSFSGGVVLLRYRRRR